MVIGQRMAMFLLGGPQARKEAQLMVTEKVKAAARGRHDDRHGRDAAQGRARYRRKVHANTGGGSQGLRSRRLRQGYTVGDRSAGRRSPMGQRL